MGSYRETNDMLIPDGYPRFLVLVWDMWDVGTRHVFFDKNMKYM